MIPIIDVFAGPGGLGEGFSAYHDEHGQPVFKIALSIEMDHWAHQTLELRAFYRQFPHGEAPEDYYRHLRGELDRETLFENHPQAASRARAEAWKAELGKVKLAEVQKRINKALPNDGHWILVGGPPCQAYSLAGRARNKGKEGYVFEEDSKSTLYKQYLRIISDFWPSVFVMENVKGLLTASFSGKRLFQQIQKDLRKPSGRKQSYRGGGASVTGFIH